MRPQPRNTVSELPQVGAKRKCDNQSTQEPKRIKTENNTQNDSRPIKRPTDKKVYIHGNYPNYYGYRNKGIVGVDPRISALSPEWFEGKKCLDVGCNSGIFTIDCALQFNLSSIKGIDIDQSLIVSASRNCKNTKPDPKDITSIVSFVSGDFLDWEEDSKYDAIFCMSVVKWIHVNRGDEGLLLLFHRFFDQLAEGGILVLEPQPWSSYEKCKKKISRQDDESGSKKDLNYLKKAHLLFPLKDLAQEQF